MDFFFLGNLGEIEEHLATLEELFPEWISKKTVPNGEVFYRQVHRNLTPMFLLFFGALM